MCACETCILIILFYSKPYPGHTMYILCTHGSSHLRRKEKRGTISVQQQYILTRQYVTLLEGLGMCAYTQQGDSRHPWWLGVMK